MEYIFGYGSLINSNSRLKTTPFAEEVSPISVKGYKRGWWATVPSIGPSTTFLGCVKMQNVKSEKHTKRVNGVIYLVNEGELQQTDKRENGYLREKIPIDNIEDPYSKLSSKDNVWVYLNEDSNHQPNMSYPIVQSYIDLCLNGCFEIESKFPKCKNFAREFIESIESWNEQWVNDRIFPRRAFFHEPNANRIDRLLIETLKNPNLIHKRKIE